jgi:signal transduction histidine kinase
MSFDDLGLEEALERLVANTNKESEIMYRTDIGKINISDDFVKLVIYRIVQECIKNCEKHSKADTVSLVIFQDDELHIIVEDDGVGMDVNNIPGVEDNHFGYSIINDRVEAIDGKMNLESSPGDGTKLSFDIRVN